MSLQSQLAALINLIGADIKALQTAGGSTDPEVVRDTIGSALISDTANPGLTVTVDDAGNQIKLGIDDLVTMNLSKLGYHWMLPKAGGNIFDYGGWIGASAYGTLTAATRSATNKHTRSARVDGLVTVAATSAIGGARLSQSEFVRGNAAGVGGFYYCTRFGPATGVSVATNRMFVGLRGLATARTDTEPSNDVNVIAVGWDAADTNIFMLCNDGSGVCTKTDTGIAQPTTDRSSWYQLELWCAPNDTTFYYKFTNLITGVSFSGNFGTTNIPGSTTYLSPHWSLSVGGTSSVVGMAIGPTWAINYEDI